MLGFADLLCMLSMFLKAVSAGFWAGNYSDFLRQIRCIP